MAAKVGQGNQIAIDLDGVVRSAPSLSVTEFQGQGVITGNFTQSEAKDLALVLRYGALPVQLDRQTVQTVSATLGRDSLRAGVGAGLVGLGLVAIYMLLYYRALGIVVWIGLLLTAAIMYSLVTLLGRTQRAGPEPGRGHGHHRVRRRDGGLLRRVLRAAEGRDPLGQDHPVVGRPGLLQGLPHDPGRRLGVDHRRRRPLRAERRVGPGLRLLPRPHHAARHLHRLLLHPAHGHAPRPQPVLHRGPLGRAWPGASTRRRRSANHGPRSSYERQPPPRRRRPRWPTGCTTARRRSTSSAAARSGSSSRPSSSWPG